jgi:uracil-DNA glycosylase
MERESKWSEKLEKEWNEPYMKELRAFVEQERQQQTPVYPPKDQVFQAFLETPYEEVKVVIVGQDPYHGPGQAHGLCFSVDKSVKKLPPSLQNIFKELQSDLGVSYPKNGCLTPWAKQGVFLLNATLTVREGEPKSHFGKGWEKFTDKVIEALAEREDPIVFILWGKSAEEKAETILSTHKNHRVLKAAHPSPYSASRFLGCRHFSETNRVLEEWGKTPISWALD